MTVFVIVITLAWSGYANLDVVQANPSMHFSSLAACNDYLANGSKAHGPVPPFVKGLRCEQLQITVWFGK